MILDNAGDKALVTLDCVEGQSLWAILNVGVTGHHSRHSINVSSRLTLLGHQDGEFILRW